MFRDMQEVRQANRALGHVWFSAESMEAFGTVVESELIGGWWFVTSDRTFDGGRAYSIRRVDSDGDVHTERSTEFGQFGSRSGAYQGAKRLARGLPAVPDDEDSDE